MNRRGQIESYFFPRSKGHYDFLRAYSCMLFNCSNQNIQDSLLAILLTLFTLHPEVGLLTSSQFKHSRFGRQVTNSGNLRIVEGLI